MVIKYPYDRYCSYSCIVIALSTSYQNQATHIMHEHKKYEHIWISAVAFAHESALLSSAVFAHAFCYSYIHNLTIYHDIKLSPFRNSQNKVTLVFSLTWA